jgi:hypothetical protein
VQDSGGTIIGVGSDFFLSQTISATTTSFAIYTSTVRSPRIIPSEIYLVIETTVAIATDACYIDEVILAEMMPIAAGGPALAIVAGSTDWSADDNARYTFTNNDEGAFVRAFDRFFDMYGKGLSLPANYAGGENIDDALIA